MTQVGGQAVLGRQLQTATPWLTERHGYDPTWGAFASTFSPPMIHRITVARIQHVGICDRASVPNVCLDDPSRHSGPGPSTLTSARSIRTETAAAVIHRITSAPACNTLTSAMKRSCRIRCLVTYRVTRPAPIRLTSAIERPYRNRASMIYRITAARMQHVDIHDRAFVLHPLPRDSSRHSARSRYVDICDEAFVPEPRLDDLSHHSRPLQHVDIRDRAFVLEPLPQ